MKDTSIVLGIKQILCKCIPVRSLKQRFVINYPVRKANGKYVWVKEMVMPYQLDANNMVVTQISSYTIICKFIGFHLPVAPRFYDASSLKNYFHEIHNTVEEKFGWIFRDHYDAAMFLKGLRYVRPDDTIK